MSSTATSIDLSAPLAPPSPPTTSPSRRQSCDRCHSQKLRCTPVKTNRTGACSRCYRHGTQCVYSLSRPKGRPSLHHYKGETVLMPTTSRLETVAQLLTPEEYDCASIQEPGMTYSLQLSATPHASGTIDPCQLASDPILAPGPYLEPMPEAWSDHALQRGICSWDTTHAQYHPIGFSWMSNTHMDIQTGDENALQDSLIPELQGDWHLGPVNVSSQGRQLPLCRLKNATIALGRLIPRVQALSNKIQEVFKNRRISYKQGDTGRCVPPLLLNDGVFKLVMAWLFNPSEDTDDEGSILNSLWATKNELRNEEVIVELLSCSSEFTKATVSLQKELGSRIYKAVSDNHVAHHLVVACNVLLLDSFEAILGALQDVADAERHTAQGTITPGFADLRLAMVVQLCSYLFVRQCRVVDAYLEEKSGPKSNAGPPNGGSDDWRVIQTLKAGVDSRFAWFQTFWHGST
ncbi:transcriptional regulator [Fusarium pseudoanthophilum]|uniref:Transcriptional regulator n=1 Tax=Fusarium pseudoanthophilum TaxID=48495 RepID=A0A8H5NN65_9HYPO|nr:transcriptional regulator [Fusarium pseudoanthophilum]